MLFTLDGLMKYNKQNGMKLKKIYKTANAKYYNSLNVEFQQAKMWRMRNRDGERKTLPFASSW